MEHMQELLALQNLGALSLTLLSGLPLSTLSAEGKAGRVEARSWCQGHMKMKFALAPGWPKFLGIRDPPLFWVQN